MAFTLPNWTCVSSSLSSPQEAIIPFGATNPVTENAPNLYTYGSPDDSAATIAAANYFLPQYASLGVGDLILGFGTDASFALQVTAVSSTSVTTESFSLTGAVGTANITDNAVTFAKMQQIPADSLLGNATGGTANVEDITLGNGLSFTGTALGLANTNLRYVAVAMTLAQFLAMSVTPFTILTAPGAGLMHIVDSAAINFVYGSANLVGGGAVGLQYGATAALAGHAASATEAATDYTAAGASTMFRIGGGLGTGAPTATSINAAVTISNTTAPFTVGTGGSFVVNCWYKTVSAT
jgi:hypothetical protein